MLTAADRVARRAHDSQPPRATALRTPSLSPAGPIMAPSRDASAGTGWRHHRGGLRVEPVLPVHVRMRRWSLAVLLLKAHRLAQGTARRGRCAEAWPWLVFGLVMGTASRRYPVSSCGPRARSVAVADTYLRIARGPGLGWHSLAVVVRAARCRWRTTSTATRRPTLLAPVAFLGEQIMLRLVGALVAIRGCAIALAARRLPGGSRALARGRRLDAGSLPPAAIEGLLRHAAYPVLPVAELETLARDARGAQTRRDGAHALSWCR